MISIVSKYFSVLCNKSIVRLISVVFLKTKKSRIVSFEGSIFNF